MNQVYIENRRHVYEKLENNSVAIFHSGYKQFKSADAIYPFVVNHNFYYLTGIDQADVILVIGKMNEMYMEWLFIEPVDEYMAKWVGATLTKEEASAISGIQVNRMFDLQNMKSKVATLYQPNRYVLSEAKKVYLDLEQHDYPLYQTFALQYATQLRNDYPSIQIANCYSMLIELRMTKNEAEVALIKESIGTTKRAIYNVMNHHLNLCNESFANAYHDFTIIQEGKTISFGSIIASGHNATILHYEDNNQDITPNSLLLMDVGCYTKHYSSDISRTFPVSGKFTSRQKEVYEVVLDVNKKCIAYATAGMSWKELNDYAKKLLYEGCKKLGLLQEESELIRYYFHSIGHSLGLDVHDPAHAHQGLKKGMVITIEPGLYIEEEGIGIRIEDNILITDHEAICLSKDIIKEVNDIEEYMNQQ